MTASGSKFNNETKDDQIAKIMPPEFVSSIVYDSFENERKLDTETFYSYVKEAIIANNFNFLIDIISKNPHIDINHTFPSVYDKRNLVRISYDPNTLTFNESFFDSKQDIIVLYNEKIFYVSYKNKSIEEIPKKTINSEAYEKLKLCFPIQNNICKLADSAENLLINQVNYLRELKTLLQLAIEQNNTPLFDCLLKHPKIHIDRPLLKEALPVPPIIYAVIHEKPYFLESLIKAGAKRDVSLLGREAYIWIAKLNDVLNDQLKPMLKLFPHREFSDQAWLLTKMQSLKETCGFLRLHSENDRDLDSGYINKYINELATPIDDSILLIEFNNRFYHFERDSQQLNEISASRVTEKLKAVFSAMQAQATYYKTANTAELTLINAANLNSLSLPLTANYGHPDGVCQGYSMMGLITSFILDDKGELIELERFKKISERINRIPREDFRRVIKEIKNRQIQLLHESKEELRREHKDSEYDPHALQKRVNAKLRNFTPEELIDLDLLYFFDGIELFQSIDMHKQLHNGKFIMDKQKDLLFPLLATASVEREGGIICAANLQGVFIKNTEHDELKNYLETLKQQCLRSNINYPVSMILATYTHAIVLNYNPVKDEWTLILPSRINILKESNVIVTNNSDELVNSIRNAFQMGYLMYYNLNDLSIIKKDISKYIGCLTLVGKQENAKLYYIDSKGFPQEIQILDKEKFKNLIRIKSQSAQKDLETKYREPEAKKDKNCIALSIKSINELLENSQNILMEGIILSSNIYVTKKNMHSMDQILNECMKTKTFQEVFLATPEKVFFKDYFGYSWSDNAMLNNDLNQLKLLNKVRLEFISNFNADKKYMERASDHFGESYRKELYVKDKLKHIKSCPNLFNIESVREKLHSYCDSLNKNQNSLMFRIFFTKTDKYALDFLTEVLSLCGQESYVRTKDNQKLRLALFKVYTSREANGEAEHLAKINAMFKTLLSDTEFAKMKQKGIADHRENPDLSYDELDSTIMSTEPAKKDQHMQEKKRTSKL